MLEKAKTEWKSQIGKYDLLLSKLTICICNIKSCMYVKQLRIVVLENYL